MFPLVRANRDEICARLGIIIFLQPDGTPVVEIVGVIVGRVHVNFLFPVGAYGNTPRWQFARMVIRPNGCSISDTKIVGIIYLLSIALQISSTPSVRQVSVSIRYLSNGSWIESNSRFSNNGLSQNV